MVLYCEGLAGFQRVAIVVSSVLIFDNTFKTFQMLCTLFSPSLVCFDVQLIIFSLQLFHNGSCFANLLFLH